MAMNILQSYASSEGLDQVKILKMLPNDFPIAELGQYNILSFLKTVFDYKLTVQENCKIGESLASVEHWNTEIGLNNRKKGFVRLTANSMCGVCKSRIDLKRLYIYPSGEVVHKHCAIESEPGRCPVTNKTFISF